MFQADKFGENAFWSFDVVVQQGIICVWLFLRTGSDNQSCVNASILHITCSRVLSHVWPPLKLWFSQETPKTGSVMLCPPLFQGPKTIITAVLSSEFVFSLKSDAALDHRSLSRPVRVRPRRRGLRSWVGRCFPRQRPSEASNSFGLGAGRPVTPPTVSTDPPVMQTNITRQKVIRIWGKKKAWKNFAAASSLPFEWYV